MEKRIKVSVFCATFNHEKYIRNALDGFVMQKTDFAFEVLVHDDASTDNTASIVREYQEKYPDIIKPIYQTENQYSKGIKISRDILAPIAKGEYFAWCEGDDYWTDPYKLQKQVDFLDGNPDYSGCGHKVQVNYLKTGTVGVKPDITVDTDFSVEDIISWSAPKVHTSTLMLRSELYLNMPECFKIKGFGDLQLCMYAAISGRFKALKDVMSVYNNGTVGSWTERMSNNSAGIKYAGNRILLYNNINKYYDYKYDKFFSEAIRREKFNISYYSNDIKAIKLPENRVYYRRIKRAKILSFLQAKLPWMLVFAKKIKKIIRGK